MTPKEKALAILKLQAKAKLKVTYPVNFETAACTLSEQVMFTGPFSITDREKIDHVYGTEFDILVKMPGYWVAYSVDEDGEGSILSAYDQVDQVARDVEADPEYYDNYDEPVHTEASLIAAFTRRVFNISFPGSLGVWYRSW